MADDNRDLYEAATAGDLSDELASRGLPKSGPKHELVNRLVEHDAATADVVEQDAAEQDADGEICVEHWPNGWPGNDTAASCIHGQWER